VLLCDLTFGVTSTFTLVHFISSVSGDDRGKGP
jgi:hypothetical protein